MSNSSQQLTITHVSLLGPEASACAVARAIIAGLKIVDVESNLKTVALHGLLVYPRAQLALYQLLEAGNKATVIPVHSVTRSHSLTSPVKICYRYG